MFKRHLGLMIICLTAAAMALAQGAFTPRDADEEQAWRIHAKYKESRKKEDELTGQIALLRRDIANQSVSTIGAFGSDGERQQNGRRSRASS